MLNKKSLKTLMTAGLCLLMLGGMAPNVLAQTATDTKMKIAAVDYNLLHKNAYDAVMTCLDERTQPSINEARTAIAKLKGTPAEWAMGELSRHTDTVQHELFVKFMRYIYGDKTVAKVRMLQWEINEARDLVIAFDTYEGNKGYTPTWSATLDMYQQIIIKEALTMVERAEKEKQESLVKDARLHIEDLASARNKDVIDFAKYLSYRVNEIKIGSGSGETIPTGSIYAYKNHIRMFIDKEGFIPVIERNTSGTAWEKLGTICLEHGSDATTNLNPFSNEVHKSLGAYASVIIKNYEFESQENYSELIRLVDGQVLGRLWEKGKLEEFQPKTLTKEQIDYFNNTSMDVLLSKLK
ncbi:hypothetical protein J2Z44_000988 [Clostridium punense]|uniref:SbsC C-terminal domain-containing protein n=1 Tax=Clostridium punense TaxID=1054297 RepID=A0ABS4K1Q5_9CLOT|nr:MULTISPECIES: hypothetical protein [Clostridium]EQB90251.1 hypothetical protein M918_00985 [Clostridium sp. BL8]MBP2021201.1 hypothetical protein [Clostridium punense]